MSQAWSVCVILSTTPPPPPSSRSTCLSPIIHCAGPPKAHHVITEMNHVDKLSALPPGTSASRQIACLRGICQHMQATAVFIHDTVKHVRETIQPLIMIQKMSGCGNQITQTCSYNQNKRSQSHSLDRRKCVWPLSKLYFHTSLSVKLNHSKAFSGQEKIVPPPPIPLRCCHGFYVRTSPLWTEADRERLL